MTTHPVNIRRTYKYRLYRSDKVDRELHQRLNVAGLIWNHALALQKRYYRLFKGYIQHGRMKQHIAWLRMHTLRYAFWKALGSQAVRDVVERLDDAFQRLCRKQARLPCFKKVKRYKSFTLKQTAGWSLLRYNENVRKPNGTYTRTRGVIVIDKTQYKFVPHRPMHGVVKTITVKRDNLSRLWICFSVIESIEVPERASTSHIGGFDFGLKTFLKDNTGHAYLHPLFLTPMLKRIQHLHRAVSGKVQGSQNQSAAQRVLARAHCRIADQRRDFHFKLAHLLCDKFDVLVFADLNLSAMKQLWGRKVSDLGFYKFLKFLSTLPSNAANTSCTWAVLSARQASAAPVVTSRHLNCESAPFAARCAA